MGFRTSDGLSVPSVTAGQMREVDRMAMEDFGLGILQMMENAGRNLAQNALEMLGGRGAWSRSLPVVVATEGVGCVAHGTSTTMDCQSGWCLTGMPMP